MVKQKRSRQTWWPLYAWVLMIAGLLILAHRLAPSPGWRTFLDVGVVVVGYGLIALWLETHSTALLDRPAAEADSPAIESPELEMPSPLSSRVRVHFYIASDPALIYSMPEPSTSDLHSNGPHPVSVIPFLPEEAAKRFTNN